MSPTTPLQWPDATPHLWAGVPDGRYGENFLALLERHDLTLVNSCWNMDPDSVAALEEDLARASDRDVDVWVGTGDLRQYTDEELVSDADKREAYLDRLRAIADTYADYYPDGKLFLWHETPLTGNWTGDTREERADSVARNGPAIFAAQRRAVRERHPDVDVGLMIHYPYLAPPDHTEQPLTERLMDGFRERDAMPEFMYFDMYHGYQEWEGGYDASTEYLRAIVEHLREHTGDRPVYFLGQAHTINNNFTPSKQSILGHLWAALDAGAAGFGWYERGGFRETSPRNYAPFVPNVGEIADPEAWNSVTGSRDRYLYATLALLEHTRGVDPEDRFDLWVYGHDLNFYDHRVSARTAEGDWEFLGDVSGYVDGDNPYSGGGRDRVHAFRALDRDRFLADGRLDVRVETHDDADGGTLHAVYAMPSLDTSHFLTEGEATGLVEDGVEDCALGVADPGADLGPGTETTATLDASAPAESLAEAVRPTHRAELDRLAALEREASFSPKDYFDLWVYGESVSNLSVSLTGTPLGAYAAPGDADRALVFRGLERAEFFEDHTGGQYLDLGVAADGEATLHAVYAMPYHGTANLTTDAEAAAIVDRDHGEGEGQLNAFSLGHHAWAGGRHLAAGGRVNPWVHLAERSITTVPHTPRHNQAYGWWE